MEFPPVPIPSKSRLPILGILLLVTMFVIGWWLWRQTSTTPPTNNAVYIEAEPHCIPEDLSQCPDGTFIRRELPDCATPVCPETETIVER